MHLGIFYGFIVLLLGTLIIAIQVDFQVRLLYGKFYLLLSLSLDLFGLAVIIGMVIATYKRFKRKPDSSNTIDDVVTFILVFTILFSGFALEGLRIYVTGDPWAGWTPVGLFFSTITRMFGVSIGLARSAHVFLWYLHMLLGMGFIAYIPYSKLFHMFAAPLNIFLRPLTHRGVLSKPEILPKQGDIGVSRLQDFSKKQLLELDACVSCGRCQKHCPAYESGAPLSPQKLLRTLKEHSKQARSSLLNGRVMGAEELIDKVISRESLWSCTTCGLCEEKCPVNIEHISRIVDIRRGLMQKSSDHPPEIQEFFDNIAGKGNPWGLGENSKVDLTHIPTLREKQQTDVLYWVGCFGTYENRNTQVTLKMCSILQKSGVDFAVLGTEENCCGDSVRRLGNELGFQRLAKENIQVLKQYKFNKIVTHCPHCYNTLKNEYPEFGGKFTVLHHTEFILELIQAGRIEFKKLKQSKVTFHDPCYLGRYNNVYDAPRQVLSAIPGLELIEMKYNKSHSFCCGAGGGRIWMRDEQEQRMNEMRVKQACNLQPDILASACSLCLTNLTEAVSKLDAKIVNADIAELVYDAIF
ncbi:MAG TPA: heterodisulfide reductase-related iron-sulfur binding cluster [Candidatus Deferrimicrobium sp.]|nr:heterodisulfide reductase-related iron-sulfur binding cluster [Candidatus Deferrimicrobium sp.]